MTASIGSGPSIVARRCTVQWSIRSVGKASAAAAAGADSTRSAGRALITALAEGLGADFDEPTRAAWVAVYALVSTTMMTAAGQIRRAAWAR